MARQCAQRGQVDHGAARNQRGGESGRRERCSISCPRCCYRRCPSARPEMRLLLANASSGKVMRTGIWYRAAILWLLVTLASPGYAQSAGSGTDTGSQSGSSASASHQLGETNHKGRVKRNGAAKKEFMRRTGYPHGRKGYVVDHIIPLACGGPDTPENMQWQSKEAAKAKDKWERRGCR